MKTGIVVIILSAVWALFLLTHVESFMGQRVLILSGDNILNARGAALSNNAFFFFWLFAFGGFGFGLWLTISGATNREKNEAYEEKLYEGQTKNHLKCKYCGYEFNTKLNERCKTCGQENYT